MNLNNLLGPLSAELATTEMEEEMVKSLGKTRAQIIAEYGDEYKAGNALWNFFKTAPQYNGVAGDECPCPACNCRREEFGPDPKHDSVREIPGNDVAGSPLPPGAKGFSLEGLPEGVQAIPLGGDPDKEVEGMVKALSKLFGEIPEGDIPDHYQGVARIKEHMHRYGMKRAKGDKAAKLDLTDMKAHAAKAVYAAEQIIAKMPQFLVAVQNLRAFVDTMSESPEIAEAMTYREVFKKVEAAEELVFRQDNQG